MAFYNHLSTTLSEDSTRGVSTRQRRPARRERRVSDSVQSQERPASVTDSEKPIAAGDTVYASSPKLETLQGEPLTVVSVNKSLDAAVVKDKNGKCMAVRLSYLKRE